MPIGVIVNCISVLAGGVIGSALGQVLPNSLKEHLPTLFGMCSIAIGINSIIKAVSMTAVVLAILVGFTIGHLLHLEDWASRFFHRLVKTMHLGGDNIDMEFYITAVALFCCSGFGWRPLLFHCHHSIRLTNFHGRHTGRQCPGWKRRSTLGMR